MKITLAILVISLSSTSFSQLELNSTSKSYVTVNAPNNVERYGRDYILTNFNFVNGDSTVLYKLDLDVLEQYRLEHENVEVIEGNTLMSVTLFAKEAIIHTPITNGITEEE